MTTVVVDCPGCTSPTCRACEIVRLGGIAYVRDGVTYRLANPPAPPPFVPPEPRVAELRLDGSTFVTVPPFAPLCLSHRRKHDFVIVTFVAGHRGRELYEVSRPSIERYAQRCHADVIVIPADKSQQYIFANKWRAGQVFSQYGYERLQWIDADVLVHPDADCLFDVVPENAIGLRYEENEYARMPRPDWYRDEMRELFALLSLPTIPLPPAHNWGMYLLSRVHASVFVPPAMPFPARHCSEQNWSNYVAYRDGFAIHPLTAKQHWMQNWDSHDASRIDAAQFLHFCGMGWNPSERLRLMREAVAKWR